MTVSPTARCDCAATGDPLAPGYAPPTQPALLTASFRELARSGLHRTHLAPGFGAAPPPPPPPAAGNRSSSSSSSSSSPGYVLRGSLDLPEMNGWYRPAPTDGTAATTAAPEYVLGNYILYWEPACAVRAPPQHGLSSKTMALITSECGATPFPSIKRP